MRWTPRSIADTFDSGGHSKDRLARLLLTWTRDFTTREQCSIELREDIVQDVMVTLFKDRGRVLKRWQPLRGLSLRSFVRWVVRYQVRQRLRVERRNTSRSDPTSPEVIDQIEQQAPKLLHYVSVQQVRGRLLEGETTRSRILYRGLFVEQRLAQELAQELGMTRGAVDQWKARFKKRAAKLLGQLEYDGASLTS